MKRSTFRRYPLMPGVGALGSTIVTLWKANFGTDQAAPMPASYTVDIGVLDKSLDGNNVVSVASGKLDFNGTAVTNFTNPAYAGKDRAGNGFARANGRVLAFDFEVKTNTARPVYAGLSNSANPSSLTTIGIYFVSGGGLNLASLGSAPALTTWAIGTYQFRIIEFSDGFALFGKGGSLGSSWVLLWIDHTTSGSPLYPSFQGVSQSDYEVDRAELKEGLGAPFNTDYGLGVFNLTSGFNQSLGAELFTNGNFASGLTGWTLTHVPPDPEVTEVGSGVGHGGGGTGAMNLFSSATANQPRAAQTILTNGGLYLLDVNIATYVSGSLALLDSGAVGINTSFTAAGRRKIIGRASGTELRFQGGATCNVTVDDNSAKRITVNTPQTMPSADSQIDLFYNAPGTPVAGDPIHLIYRMTAAGEELNNCWSANANKDVAAGYTVNLDSYAAGVRTNRATASGISPQAIKVKFEGNDHRLYRLNSGVWTIVGSAVTNATHNTALLTNVMYEPGYTITRWVGYRKSSPVYDSILDAI